MESRPIRYRRSYRLHPPEALLLSIGLWVVIGIFGLYDSTWELAGSGAGWIYVVTGLFLIPTMLGHAELRSWMGRGGGSYRLIQTVERPTLTFFAGWTYILGWTALSALLAHSFAQYATDLIHLFSPDAPDPTVLALIVLLFFVLTNIAGFRPNWRLAVWLVGSAMIGVVVLIALLLVGGGAGWEVAPYTGRENFSGAITLLVASMWAIELTAEMQEGRRGIRYGLVSILGGPLLGCLLALTGAWTGAYSLQALAEQASPIVGPLLLLIGMLATGFAWQVLALVMLRQFQSIGRSGLLPKWLLRRYTRFKTPVLLIGFQALLTVGGIFLGLVLNVAHLAALAFLVLQIGVNATVSIMARHPRAANRSLVLPIYPVIPASGAAICFLILILLPFWPTILLSVVWYALGGLLFWRVIREAMRVSQIGVTVFQDTTRRPDTTSTYPVIVPVANPDTAHSLVAFGAAIARYFGGHVTVVQVLQVSEQLPLDSERVQAQQKLGLLEQLLEETEHYGVPVEGITRLSRGIAQGILDTATEESARLIVMGWQARPQQPGQRGLGHIIDEVLEAAACDVAIVRGEWANQTVNVLVPVSGGPHAPHAAELGLALTKDTNGLVTLLNITRQSDGEEAAIESGQTLVEEVKQGLGDPERAVGQVTAASSPLAGILEAAQDQDAILLGASELGFMDRQIFGQLHLQIAQETDKPMVLMRSHVGLTSLVARRAWQSVSDVLPTLSAEEQVVLYRNSKSAARPAINYFVLITLSAMIATLGLLLNSPAVIIGAMLVAPLMGPLVAAAGGIAFGNASMLSDALRTTLMGVLVAIFLALLVTLISPLSEATPEIMARTRPNLLDLMVALVSGAAGAYVIARTEVSDALPGVAIAAALMPPVCTVGIGFALGSLPIAFGALLLFIANLVAIIFASAIVFLLLGAHPPQRPDQQRWLRQGLIISLVSLVAISLPLGFVLFSVAEQSQIEKQSQAIVQETVREWGDVKLVEFDVEHGWREVTITGTLYATHEITDADMKALDDRLEAALRPAVTLQLFVIEGSLLNMDAP